MFAPWRLSHIAVEPWGFSTAEGVPPGALMRQMDLDETRQTVSHYNIDGLAVKTGIAKEMASVVKGQNA